MKKNIIFVALLAIFLLPMAVSAAKAQNYIVKFRGDDEIHVITEDEKNQLENKGLTLYQGEIEYIEPDYEMTLFAGIDFNWNVGAINTAPAWDSACFGNDIRVAVIDTGVNELGHFSNNILPGYNFLDNNNDTADDHGHGTFISRIIAAKITGEHPNGISYKTKIVPIKCFDSERSPTTSMIYDAIKSAVDDYNCRVINMSFGDENYSQTMKNAVDYALSKNVILVAAVGNYGETYLCYPAAFDGVVGVGSVDDELEHSNFSQRNESVDVVAPGQGVITKAMDGQGYLLISGTSFAAPHVSAAAAIALSANNKLTPEKFNNLIRTTSQDLGDEGYDEYYGHGLLDIGGLADSLILEYDFFMSPINLVGSGAQIQISNNTDEDAEVTGILVNYDDDVMTGMNLSRMTLPAKSRQTVVINDLQNNLKYFLLSRVQALKPLSPQRAFAQN